MSRSEEIVEEANQRLAVARSGLAMLSAGMGEGRVGIRNVAVFGRMVTFATNNLRSQIEGFADWDLEAKARHFDNAECRYMVELRNSIEKQARTPTRLSARMSFNTDDLKKFPAPPGAKGFFIGDQNGGSGWMLDDGKGGEVPYYIKVPDEMAVIALILPDFRDMDATEVAQKYVSSLEQYLLDVRNFVGAMK